MVAFGKKSKVVNKYFVYAAIDDTDNVERPRMSWLRFGQAAAIPLSLPLTIVALSAVAGLSAGAML